MGFGTIRQIRSKTNVNCQVLSQFNQYFNNCQGWTLAKYEDQTPAYDSNWMPINNNDTNGPNEYVYQSAEQLQGVAKITNQF
jgi:hypothetical protein